MSTVNGPKHYREAERLVDVAREELAAAGREKDVKVAERHLRHVDAAHQRAQVHATLALAAATICAGNQRITTGMEGDDTRGRAVTYAEPAMGAEWSAVIA